jgi:co-chaperonin GroES (HSP10)
MSWEDAMKFRPLHDRVVIDGQELLIMRESDFMGILDQPVSKKKAA